MILCDLPYGVTKCAWDSVIDLPQLWTEYRRIIKPNGAILLFGIEPFSSTIRLAAIDLFRYDWIWEKTSATGHLNVKKRPMVAHEIVSVQCDTHTSFCPVVLLSPDCGT